MIPMMMMMMRPTARIKATRSWNQPGWADLGEPTKMAAKSIRDKNAAGFLVKDKNGNVITTYDGLPDSDFAPASGGTPAGRYANLQVDVPWQDWMDLGLFFEDDICYAHLGCETNRPSASNGGYELHKRFHVPAHGTWHHLSFATTYAPFRPYRAATGSNRIIDVHEVDGACTLTMIDPVDGNKETVTANMLTDSDDLSARPSVQTGNVAMHHGTVDSTTNTALRLFGAINEPICEAFRVGGSTSKAYDPQYIRTRWVDGKTWNLPYSATIHQYCTNYYGIEYSENDELKLKAVPIYDYLTKQAGFQDEASPTNRLIFSEGTRPFKPVWDDHLIIPEEEGA